MKDCASFASKNGRVDVGARTGSDCTASTKTLHGSKKLNLRRTRDCRWRAWMKEVHQLQEERDHLAKACLLDATQTQDDCGHQRRTLLSVKLPDKHRLVKEVAGCRFRQNNFLRWKEKRWARGAYSESWRRKESARLREHHEDRPKTSGAPPLVD